MTTPILELRDARKWFEKPAAGNLLVARGIGGIDVLRAVDGVSVAVHDREVVGLVGESGCGKSTLGKLAVGLYRPTSGKVVSRGTDVTVLKGPERRALQLSTQMIFQDPYSSLNPRMRVSDIICEAPIVHGLFPRSEQSSRVAGLLQAVGLDPAMASRFPHQFSGGQRARIGIARALAVKPALLVCDEAVAALDVSIQAQVLNLFIQLREERNLAYLFISHDLGVVRHLSDRVVVMYLGRVVESGPNEDMFAAPNHPYTKALLAEVPSLANRRRGFIPVAGEIPSLLAPPTGCHFHPRCPHAFSRCRTDVPELKTIAPGRQSACHLNDGV